MRLPEAALAAASACGIEARWRTASTSAGGWGLSFTAASRAKLDWPSSIEEMKSPS